MRTPYLAGNWKMNLDGAAIRAFCDAVKGWSLGADAPRIGLFPPALYLPRVVGALDGTGVTVGAQTGRPEASGAFTGECSLGMVKDVGATSVILGHSERRHVFGETDEDVRARVDAALELGLEVVLCVGETIEERQAERTNAVVLGQLVAGLSGLDAETIASRITVAYEPVWAIGTGHTATPDQAQEVHAAIRGRLATLAGDDVAARTIIQYGGSVKPGNAAELLAQPDVDGALVGGASLEPASFEAICRAGVGAKA